MNQTWKPVSSLEQGQIYMHGNVGDFIAMTGWTGYSVLYFGDHVFSDLAVSSISIIYASMNSLQNNYAVYRTVCVFEFELFFFLQDPIMQLGWKTGAIIPELKVYGATSE